MLKNISFLFISRSFFIRTISIQFIVSLLPIYVENIYIEYIEYIYIYSDEGFKPKHEKTNISPVNGVGP